MAKRRSVAQFSSAAVPVEHRDGGTWGIFPMNLEQAQEYVEIISKQEFERNDDGSIIFNPDKRPLRKSAVTVGAMLTFAQKLVDHIDDFEFDGGQPVESTPENILELLKLMGTTEVEIDANGMEFTGEEGQVRLRDAVAGKTPEQLEQMLKEKLFLRKSDLATGMRVIKENHYLWVMRVSARLAAEKNAIERKNS